MNETQKNTRVSARTLKRNIPDTTLLPSEKEDIQRRYANTGKRLKLVTISDKLANDKLCYLNWYYPGGKDEFPQHDNLRSVAKMYPNAEGGQLLIDEPRFPWEVERCEMKKAVLKKLGFRYVIIMPQMTYEEAIGELNK